IYNRTAGRDRVRVVHTYHGHVLEGYFSPGKTRLFVAIERALARATDRIIAISPRICGELQQQYRIGAPRQYRLVAPWFHLHAFAAIDDRARLAARDALQMPPGAAVVTTVGRITAIKHQQLFLDVAKQVLDARRDVVFLIVGDGELRAELEQRARTL